MKAGSASTPTVRREARESLQHRFMTFLLNGRKYGLPLHHVAEVTPFRALNRLPHMPKGVEGLLELRGRVVPVLNLRARMSLPPLDPSRTGTILVLELAGLTMGLLVDSVETVLSVAEEDLVSANPLLAGLDGAWVSGFIVQGERVIALLDAALVASQGTGRPQGRKALASLSLESRMDEGLRRLIAMAPSKEGAGHPVLPQIDASISYTEQEMAKVLDRVEAMLASTGKAFHGLSYLKQEAGLGRFKGHERDIADLERTNQEVQDTVFALIQQMQFQDIARQKLERVMEHLRGMQVAITGTFRRAAP